jgi:hypothetical protein
MELEKLSKDWMYGIEKINPEIRCMELEFKNS